MYVCKEYCKCVLYTWVHVSNCVDCMCVDVSLCFWIDHGASGLPHRNSPMLGPCLAVRGEMGAGSFSFSGPAFGFRGHPCVFSLQSFEGYVLYTERELRNPSLFYIKHHQGSLFSLLPGALLILVIPTFRLVIKVLIRAGH